MTSIASFVKSLYMNTFHVGCDICSVKRIQKSYEDFSESFLNKFLSPLEVKNFKDKDFNKERAIQFLAGRWAAKEALFKALSTNYEWKDVHNLAILNDSNRRPYVSPINGWNISLSISHETEYAMAYVIAVKNTITT